MVVEPREKLACIFVIVMIEIMIVIVFFNFIFNSQYYLLKPNVGV